MEIWDLEKCEKRIINCITALWLIYMCCVVSGHIHTSFTYTIIMIWNLKSQINVRCSDTMNYIEIFSFSFCVFGEFQTWVLYLYHFYYRLSSPNSCLPPSLHVVLMNSFSLSAHGHIYTQYHIYSAIYIYMYIKALYIYIYPTKSIKCFTYNHEFMDDPFLKTNNLLGLFLFIINKACFYNLRETMWALSSAHHVLYPKRHDRT